MTHSIVFRRSARTHFMQAMEWYVEHGSIEVGLRFEAAVAEALARVAEQPELYAPVRGDVRRAPVSGFPYYIYYRATRNRVVVGAIVHGARGPSASSESF